jgi:hypothetical protein
VEHPLPAVLALCAGAVVAGMASFTAIASWVTDVPADLLTGLYARYGQVARAPSKARCGEWSPRSIRPRSMP